MKVDYAYRAKAHQLNFQFRKGSSALEWILMLELIMRILLGDRVLRNSFKHRVASRREPRHDNEPLNDCRSEERFYYLAVGKINPLPTKRLRVPCDEHFITNFRLPKNALQAIKTGLNFAWKDVTLLNDHRRSAIDVIRVDLIFADSPEKWRASFESICSLIYSTRIIVN